MLVLPTDDAPVADRSWLVRVGRAPALTTRREGRSADALRGEVPADVVLRGTAVELYLALWNRGDEVWPEGVADWWEAAAVEW